MYMNLYTFIVQCNNITMQLIFMNRFCLESVKMFYISILVLLSSLTIFKSYTKGDDNTSSAMVLDKRLLQDSEAFDIFNKTLASKHGLSKLVLGSRSARTPPTVPVSQTTRHPSVPVPTSPGGREIPSYAPPSRAFFTPPLPPEFLNPFADKPTLRGSNSDGNNVGSRRPIPPPSLRLPSEAELIPIRPPDLQVMDTRKKTLNTPSFKKVAELPFSDTTSTTTTNSRSVNETFDFVPILPYPSVSRILSGGNGRKHDIIQDILERPRFDSEPKAPRTIKQEVVKTLIPPSIRPPEIPEIKIQPINVKHEINTSSPSSRPTIPPRTVDQVVAVERTESPQAAKDPPEIAQSPEPEPRVRQVLGIAWDIHVYLIAILFTILAVFFII
uniref:Uncharacterized protein n=1 Tax=Clastoptera arizonana TaxID=38151 RepID=A0A1B6DRK4_9HEMI